MVFAIILFHSCWMPAPREVLREKDMIDVLVDVHIADAILFNEGYRYDRDSADSVIINKYYDAVFVKHDITRNSFNKSIDYYSNKRTEQYGKMYDQVIERISKMEEELAKADTITKK